MNVTCRKMNHNDIASGLLLCRNNNWNQLSRDWELFLKLSHDSCRVATENEKIIGSVTTLCYQHLFCWIGMVLVDPAHQKKGIGKQLLNEALLILKNEETIKLDATPAGRELYLQLNFEDEYDMMRMQAIVDSARLLPSSATPIQEDEWSQLAALDNLVFGAERSAILHWFWEAAKEYAFIVKESGNIIGYCLGRHGHWFDQIGPVVADDTHVAKQLVAVALNNCNGRPIIIDALLHDPEWINWLHEMGFGEQRKFTRMYKGVNRYPGIPNKQFAIAGPEYG